MQSASTTILNRVFNSTRRSNYPINKTGVASAVTAISVTAFLAVMLFPEFGHAAASEPAAEFGPILLGLAILVLGAKLGGILLAQWRQPAVLGELLFGITLANVYPLFARPAGIEFVRFNTSLRVLAEIVLPFPFFHL